MINVYQKANTKHSEICSHSIFDQKWVGKVLQVSISLSLFYTTGCLIFTGISCVSFIPKNKYLSISSTAKLLLANYFSYFVRKDRLYWHVSLNVENPLKARSKILFYGITEEIAKWEE